MNEADPAGQANARRRATLALRQARPLRAGTPHGRLLADRAARALEQAYRDGRIPRNVVSLVSAPRAARYEVAPLSLDGARRFIAATRGHRLGRLYALAAGTRLRQGEALGLRWTDVDLDGGLLHVSRTLWRAPLMFLGPDDGGRGTRYVLAEPKTDRSRRTLRLLATIVARLRDHRVRQLEERVAARPA